MKYVFFYETVIGKIGIIENENTITNVYFDHEVKIQGIQMKETPLIKETARQLREYLEGKRKNFQIPFTPKGTEFQKDVWNALLTIPYGETCSYKEIAEKVGRPKAARAVGMANNKNPIAIIIPCHRVIGANGKLVGYGGGLDIKEHLLHIEKENR